MKVKFRKLTISFLMMAVFLSVISCCCLTDLVQAQEPVPSCHQTSESESSQQANKCECDQSYALIKKDISFVPALESAVWFSVDQEGDGQHYDAAVVLIDHAPPFFDDAIPLYIKHSNLRI